ncbi:hypothetical protein BC835DRAFT_1410074 [Cytidiella melzeri]|nr:hypothetical protein BC835DRAFT_1410074 [Cytidiella melzeri]
MFSRTLPVLLAVIALIAIVSNAIPLEGSAKRATLASRAVTHKPSPSTKTTHKREPLEAREWSNAKRMAAGLSPRAPTPAHKPTPSPSAKSTHKREPLESREWSNSKRMAAGLSPRAPKVRPSPSLTKRQYPSPSPAPNPVQTFSGRVMIKTSSSAPLIGYVSGGSPARVDVQGKNGGDLTVQFTTQVSSGTPFNLEATNGGFSPVYIGGSSNQYLSSHSSANVPITNVPATLAYQRPTSEGASAIWTLNPSTKQIMPRWTNIDGSAPSVVIGYNWQSNSLFLTGDLAVYNAATGSKAIAVEFYLA